MDDDTNWGGRGGFVDDDDKEVEWDEIESDSGNNGGEVRRIDDADVFANGNGRGGKTDSCIEKLVTDLYDKLFVFWW